MNRPIYLQARGEIPFVNGNSGLLFDKFCPEWCSDWSGLGKEGTRSWLKKFDPHPVGNGNLLAQTITRIQKLVKVQQGWHGDFTTSSSFVSGLGRSNPVENGFAWHHTLGVPYLAGSSVKGLVRAWALLTAEEEVVFRIFGPRGQEEELSTVGSVIFLDALPTSPVQLKIDVMTPHYGPWYADAAVAPGDWHDPVPIPFLTVAAGQAFLFAIMPRNVLDQQTIKDVAMVKEWLITALDLAGAGAKTDIGYGRFDPPKVPLSAEFEEVWCDSVLTWEKNRGRLNVKNLKKELAFIDLSSEEARVQLVPEQLHKKLFAKGEAVKAVVTVSRQGKANRIVKIEL